MVGMTILVKSIIPKYAHVFSFYILKASCPVKKIIKSFNKLHMEWRYK